MSRADRRAAAACTGVVAAARLSLSLPVTGRQPSKGVWDMRRATGLLLVLTAISGVTAASSSASAGFYECTKTAGGQYSDKHCATLAGKGAGKYELRPGVGKSGSVKGKNGAVALRIPAVGSEMKCAGGKSAFNLISTTELNGTITWSKCVASGNVCNSTGETKGTVSAELVGVLGTISKPAPASVFAAGDGIGGVSVGLKKRPGGKLEIACGGHTVQLTGSAVAGVSEDVNQISKLFNWSFALNEEGLQLYSGFEGEPSHSLEATVDGAGPFAAALSMASVNKGESLELKVE